MKTLNVTGNARMLGAACSFAFCGLLGAQVNAEEFAVQINCSGEFPNNWEFSADALGNRFLHVIWSGPQSETRVTLLSYYSQNMDGLPVFTGTFQDTVDVMLIDQSGGTVADGTEILVFSEEWGWNNGTCRTLPSSEPEDAYYVEVIRQSLVGSRDTSATNWMRRNGFSRGRTEETTGTGKIERWERDTGYSVSVVFYRGRVSDVLSVLD